MVPLRSRAAASLLHLLPRGRITRALGRFTEARIPLPLLRPVLAIYSRAYDVALDEAVVPSGGFRSFNEFFTRQLREGIHRVDADPATVVSPADGRLDDAGPVTSDRRFTVKGQEYDAATLLDDVDAARAYEGGHYFIVYLSPRDYHRVHSPVAGRVREVRHIPGDLFPVNAMGVRTVPGLFARNERVVVHVDTALGPAAVVFVGAFVVGKITLTIDAPPRPELGGRAAFARVRARRWRRATSSARFSSARRWWCFSARQRTAAGWLRRVATRRRCGSATRWRGRSMGRRPDE
jgi:phosphatidylserine decarboxylase